MKILNYIGLLLPIICSGTASSEVRQKLPVRNSPLHLGIGTNVSFSKHEGEYDSYTNPAVVLGYDFRENSGLALEMGLKGVASDNSLDLNAGHVMFKNSWDLTQYSSWYLGAGSMYYDNAFRPLIGVGFNYDISKSIYLDAGYSTTVDSANELNLTLLLNYRLPFNPSQVRRILEHERKLYQDEISLVELASSDKTSGESVEIITPLYIVKRGDYLIKIAKQSDMTLNEIIESNPFLQHRNMDVIYPGELIRIKKSP